MEQISNTDCVAKDVEEHLLVSENSSNDRSCVDANPEGELCVAFDVEVFNCVEGFHSKLSDFLA